MGNLQLSKKRLWDRESRYHCIRNRARPDIKEQLQKAQDENDILKYNMLRISEYTHCLAVSNTSVHLPDFATLCIMIEQYDKTRPGIELNADDVSESEPQRFELAESAIDSSSRSVLEPAPASLLELESNLEEKQESSSDISSESSDGVGFLHDFDKLMRRYSI
jgi:hypothetical protein